MTVRFDNPAGLVDLVTLVRDCSVSGVGRRVLLLQPDLLPPRLGRPHHVRLATEALVPMQDADRARRYALAAGRVAYSWRGDGAARLRTVFDALGRLMEDAPHDAPPLHELVRVFDLPRDGAALLAIAAAQPPPARDAAALPAAEPEAPRDALPPLTPAMVAVMETQLSSANLARFARRRTVYRAAPVLEPAWERRFLSVDELVAELIPGHNAFTDRWLFRRLTRMLDRRMMALLSAPGALRDAGPFSLDLNVSGVLSNEFLRFDAALPAGLRGQVGIELLPADILADLPAYRFAATFLRGRGYRITLRALTCTLLPLLDVAALAPDLAELRWEPALAATGADALQAGGTPWLLARANEPAALAWGRAAGITLYQGDAVRAGTTLPVHAPLLAVPA